MYFPVAISFLVALAVVLVAGGPTIAFLRSRKSVQPISPDAPEKHRLKHGTPTMGGVLLLAAVTVSVLAQTAFYFTGRPGLLISAREKIYVFAVLFVFLGGGVIGFLDDLGKARKKENKAGLSERAKLVMQLVVSLAFVALLFLIGQAGTVSVFQVGDLRWDIGLWFYPLAVLFIMGFANAVNFTDGLDGLAAGTTLIVTTTLAIACWVFPGLGGFPLMSLFYGSVAGACAGFLWFNVYPARVFMGDTGSLALGMGIASAVLAAKQELLFLIVGVVYIVEILSMMIQRYVFKYRRIRFGIDYAKANRVFRRAPLHHHFEELGWHETQVVGRFWVVSLIAGAIGLMVCGLLTPHELPEGIGRDAEHRVRAGESGR
ncbi:MAG: phospho-N-acetylmuramoyl-pentapeptide-transferase [Capsulimonadales bacterium]|nr:phospho-N-acetylmuramoyl-pentapeptide-transferase [Capsulimonadales bacterium]